MNTLRLFWFRFWHLRGYSTWSQHDIVTVSHIGVRLSWSKEGWEEEVRKMFQLFNRCLPKNWMVTGPWFGNAGIIEVHAWPVEDSPADYIPNRLTADECITRVKGVSITVTPLSEKKEKADKVCMTCGGSGLIHCEPARPTYPTYSNCLPCGGTGRLANNPAHGRPWGLDD